MHKGFLKTAAILGILSVGLGAFAAHGLKQVYTEKALLTFETGVRYQFYHVFALLIAAMLYRDFKSGSMLWACRLFVAGIILFSGSLYLLSYIQSTENNTFYFIGAVTPFGGLAFISGWLMMFMSIFRKS